MDLSVGLEQTKMDTGKYLHEFVTIVCKQSDLWGE